MFDSIDVHADQGSCTMTSVLTPVDELEYHAVCKILDDLEYCIEDIRDDVISGHKTPTQALALLRKFAVGLCAG